MNSTKKELLPVIQNIKKTLYGKQAEEASIPEMSCRSKKK